MSSISLSPQDLWQNWKKDHVNLDPKFRIFSRKAPYSEGKMGLFVNIPNLVYVLYHYQAEFSQRTRIDYEPNEIVLEIEDEQSTFWYWVVQDHFY